MCRGRIRIWCHFWQGAGCDVGVEGSAPMQGKPSFRSAVSVPHHYAWVEQIWIGEFDESGSVPRRPILITPPLKIVNGRGVRVGAALVDGSLRVCEKS